LALLPCLAREGRHVTRRPEINKQAARNALKRQFASISGA
jgi:hypothetical protein